LGCQAEVPCPIHPDNDGVLYDPRFAAMRGEHWIIISVAGIVFCRECGQQWSEFEPAPVLCLRQDGDALDEAIAAIGVVAVMLYPPAKDEPTTASKWMCSIVRGGLLDADKPPNATGFGPTPREAKSAALYVAVIVNPT
jgi:hypothetical protein